MGININVVACPPMAAGTKLASEKSCQDRPQLLKRDMTLYSYVNVPRPNYRDSLSFNGALWVIKVVNVADINDSM